MRELSIVFALLIGISSAFSQNFPPANPNTWVVDQANVLEEDREISQAMKNWETQYQTSIEMAVVTVNSLEGYDIDTYANKLFKFYGIGKADKDNGILILIAPNEHKWRIEVGYGLEAYLTDSEAASIGKNSFRKSELKKNVFDPSILRVIEGIHDEVGTETKAQRLERATQLQKEKESAAIRQAEQDRVDAANRQEEARLAAIQAEKDHLRAEEDAAAFRERAGEFFSWFIPLLLLGILGYLIYRFRRLRNLALAQNSKTRAEVVELINHANDRLMAFMNYSTVTSTLEKHGKLLDLTKTTPYWPSQIVQHTNQLKEGYQEIEKGFQLVLNRLDKVDEIDATVARINKSDLVKLKDQKLVADFFAQVETIDQLDLDADLEAANNKLNNDYHQINEIVGAKKEISQEVQRISKSEVLSKFTNHPGVAQFVTGLSQYEQLPLTLNIPTQLSTLKNQFAALEKDVAFRKELTTANLSFVPYQKAIQHARAIADELHVSRSVDASFLERAKTLYAEFDQIRSNSANVDAGWNNLQTIWKDIQSTLQKSEAEAQYFVALKDQYQTALKSVPTTASGVESTMNETRRWLNQDGVSNATRTAHESFSNQWRRQITKTSGLNVSEVLALAGSLNEQLSQANELLQKAKGEHQAHLDELARQERLRQEAEHIRLQAIHDAEERARLTAIAFAAQLAADEATEASRRSSHTYESNNVSPTPDTNYGGGDSGGGGASGEW